MIWKSNPSDMQLPSRKVMLVKMLVDVIMYGIVAVLSVLSWIAISDILDRFVR